MHRSAEELDHAVRKAGEWLLAQQQSSGAVQEEVGLEGYYTCPVLCQVIGAGGFAHRCLDHVRANLMPDGVPSIPPICDKMKAYMPSWLAVGSQAWGRVDVARLCMEYVSGFQGDQGGLYGTEQRELVEFDSTSIACIAAVATGRVELASQIGEYLLRLQREQPEPADRFCWNRLPDGRYAAESPSADEAPLYVMVKGQPRQGFWKSGLLIVACCQLYRLTADRGFLEAACAHFDFAAQVHDDLYELCFGHKFGWAAAVLYRITRDEKHLEAARRVADLLVDCQLDDGRFLYRGVHESPADLTYGLSVDCTVQFATWIANTRWCLA